jgi:hypothetical protein
MAIVPMRLVALIANPDMKKGCPIDQFQGAAVVADQSMGSAALAN